MKHEAVRNQAQQLGIYKPKVLKEKKAYLHIFPTNFPHIFESFEMKFIHFRFLLYLLLSFFRYP